MKDSKLGFNLRERHRAASALALIPGLAVFVVLFSFFVIAPILSNQTAMAQVGVSIGYIDPKMDGWGGTVSFGVFADYVFPNTGILVGAEVRYWQKTEALTLWELWYNPYYGYYYFTYDADVKMADLSLTTRLGWQLPKHYGRILPYFGLSPGLHILKAKVHTALLSRRVTEDWTKFGIDFWGGLRFNVSKDTGLFIMGRYSLIMDSDYDDWNHLFVGGGVEFYLFD